jgi:hypothetical protein
LEIQVSVAVGLLVGKAVRARGIAPAIRRVPPLELFFVAAEKFFVLAVGYEVGFFALAVFVRRRGRGLRRSTAPSVSYSIDTVLDRDTRQYRAGNAVGF